VFTIGYEKRNGEELINLLLDHKVEVLADVREKPMSRKPDFRGGVLKASCERAGILYQGWPALGSTQKQRDYLHETGNFAMFARRFRAYAKRALSAEILRLAGVVGERRVALLCYERCHDECHRSIVADMLATKLGVAIIRL
jgi:uncharacterized protein (DUF488 family)